MSRFPRAALAGAALVLAGGCGSSDGGEAGAGSAPLVVATTTIWADIAGNAACDGLARVEAVVPPGADAHSFEPSLADRGRLADADLVVANGLGLEEGLEDTLGSAEQDGTPVFRAGDHVDVLHRGEAGGPEPADADGDHGLADADDHGDDDHGDGDGDGDADGEGSHDHGEGTDDPHLWFDPRQVSAAVDALARDLVDHAGLDPAAVDACVADYQGRLAQTDAEVATTLERIPPAGRLLVTNHDALGYFARRYGFEVVGTVIPSTSSLAETNPAALEALARLVAEAGVTAVFTEVDASATEADALADRAGDVTVVPLFTEALGPQGSEADTYLDLLRANAERIAQGLTGSA